ncbi:MAG: ATP-binding cassette domain-containing protein [Bacilli bacterium]|nr:ATP-binding cassette domain-containing protein [Bacilli bacterium]
MEKENKQVVLSVKDLKVNFSTDHGYVQAVRGVSFDLYKGETLCIVGESGSGKSVTSKTIMGILAANGRIVSGSIIYEGEDLTKVSEDEFHRIRGHKIGMIFQDPLSSLNPIMRIGKQITEAMLINNNRLKKKYDDLVADELVAYKNSITELDSGIARQKENVKFLKSEKKKTNSQIRNKARIQASGKKFNEKIKYKEAVLIINGTFKKQAKELESLNLPEEEYKNKYSAFETEKNSKITAEKQRFAETLKQIREEKREIKKTISSEIKANSQDFNDKIKTAKNDKKVNIDKLKQTYRPLVKENRAKYLAKSKKAKVQVKDYKLKLKSEYQAEKAEILKRKVNATTRHAISEINADLKKAKINYISKLKITKHEAKERALKIMKEVGISEPEKRFKQYPFEFSGGMRQRIVIAIALTADPDILICDEPTTALDVTIQAQILELINRLKVERKLSCIFITHDLGVVANMADRVAVMYAGKIVEYGTENEIFYDPRHPYTWALLSSIPDIDSKEKLEAIPGTPPNMVYPPVGDAFALRSKYALAIDFKKEPPLFKISETHYAATWLLDPRAPKVEMPKIVKTRIQNSLKAAKKGDK